MQASLSYDERRTLESFRSGETLSFEALWHQVDFAPAFALKRKGLISASRNPADGLSLTDAGRAYLENRTASIASRAFQFVGV